MFFHSETAFSSASSASSFPLENWCQIFLSMFMHGQNLNVFFHPEAFVVSPSSFPQEKLVSDFSICVYAWGETLIFFFIKWFFKFSNFRIPKLDRKRHLNYL